MESVDIGKIGEDKACEYLVQQGFSILERNYRSQQGEIDIIGKENNFLVFIEVKNYSFRSLVPPLVAISKSKRRSIIHAAQTYLYRNRIKNTDCRFDVVAIYCNIDGEMEINHLRNAFYVN